VDWRDGSAISFREAPGRNCFGLWARSVVRFLLFLRILGFAPSPRGNKEMAVWHEALCNGRSYQKIIQLSENEDLVPAANEDLKENHRQV
jgi:hypothetical protein